MERAEWLSEGIEKLALELLESEGRSKPHCDIAIVGSGYGGAVAAARFAGARPAGGGDALKVWVLERGREFVPGAFPERFADLPGQLRFDSDAASETRGLGEGLFDLRIGKHVTALLGNGLGGGSLINAGVLARPEAAVFERDPWPRRLDGDVLAPHLDRVETMLGAAAVPGRAPAKLAALGALAAKIDGAQSRRARIAVSFEKGRSSGGVDQEACLHCGDCFTGCNHLAKNTLAMNYLPLARRRGARLFTGVTVRAIRGRDDAWELELAFTDRQLRERFASNLPRLRARRVILAAGSYGSTAILMRSHQDGFAEVSDRQLGKRFSTNGDMIATAVGMPTPIRASAPEAVAPGERHVGPTITGMIDARHCPVPVVIEELAIPAALRCVFEEVVATFGALHDLGRIDWSAHRRGFGRDPAAIDVDALERSAVYATIGDDGAQGQMVLRDAQGKDARLDDGLRIEWQDVAEQPVFVEAVRLLRKAHGDDAILIPNPLWKLLPPEMGQVLDGGEIGGAVFTVHPLGGCAMAERAEQGVVNALGQVFRGRHGEDVHRTLVVLDGAIVPTALGINPCLTIAALAEYAVQGLASQWNLALADDLQAAIEDLPAQPPPPRIPWRAPRPTAIRLAERLTGELELAGQSTRAALEIEYAELPGLKEFLAGPSRVLPIANARLQLTWLSPGGVRRELGVTLDGYLTLLEREATTPWQRVRAAVCAWYVNRGRRELRAWIRAWLKRLPRNLITFGAGSGGPGLWARIKGWIAVASHAGERRRMHYALTVRDVPRQGRGAVDEAAPLQPGDRLLGTKIIAYIARGAPDGPWHSPWDQLTRLPIELRRDGDRLNGAHDWLEVDLPYFVQQYATQLQIARQENQPHALADLYSLVAYFARVVGKIHIWSLRAPDYPDPYPIYEFDAAARNEAREAAEKVVARTECRRGKRLPGDIEGFAREVIRLDPYDDGDAPRAACLTHYVRAGAAAPGEPVLLIHGLGAGGNTFTLPTVEENLVQHLARPELGFDPWVLDLRTSIGLPSSKTDWSFEDVAFGDIPAAVRAICEATGRPQLNVVAHCIGAAMFCMAALSGRLEGRVAAAVLSQVGPLLELPPTNRFRGYVASYLKHYLDIDELSTVSSLKPFARFVDRLLATLPYPDEEWEAHHPQDGTLTHESYCLRSHGIYGRLFEHANLNDATLDALGDYVGHIRYRTYQQTIFYATMRRLTDEHGKNAFVTYDRILRHLNFPICLLHGAKNAVFDKRGSERSFDLLASIFWPRDLDQAWCEHPEKRDGISLYEGGKRLRIVEIPGYGHQDCMIGQDAHDTVYPAISGFLRESHDEAQEVPSLVVVRPPRMGPILGWVRASEDGKHVVARIVFVPNDSRSTPEWAMTIVLKDGERDPVCARFRRLRTEGSPQTQALDVVLPDALCEYRIVLVTVHEEQYESEPEKEAAAPRGDDPFGEDLDRFPSPPIAMPKADDENGMDRAQQVLNTCKDLGLDRAPLPTGRRTMHRRYATPVSTAIVARDVLASVDRSAPADAPLCFALASCRYAATVADRELADRAFGRLRDRLDDGAAGRPRLLFLAGDNIYADATYGIFDPTDPKDRFDQRYLEAWTAPNAREVLRRIPLYPMLDDHEVAENFEGRDGKNVAEGLAAFESFQLRLTPAFRTPQDPPPGGAYAYVARASGFEFFVADTRTGRARGRGRGSFNATIMDIAQAKKLRGWLTDASRKDPGRPKFIVTPSVVAPWTRQTNGHVAYALRSDAWDGYPGSLHALLFFIASNRVRNVVFLSGDYHCSALCCLRLALEGSEPVNAYSIVCSGLYTPYPFANAVFEDLETDFAGPYRQRLGDAAPAQPGELVVEYRTRRVDGSNAFAVVSVEGRDAARRMTVEFDCDKADENEEPFRETLPLAG